MWIVVLIVLGAVCGIPGLTYATYEAAAAYRAKRFGECASWCVLVLSVLITLTIVCD